MELSERISSIKPSATLTINAKAQQLRAQGREIISLAVGEPDFQTPAHVCEAAKKALDEGFTRYTPAPGIVELREAVAGYYDKFYNVQCAAKNIIVSNGGKQGLYNLLQCLINPGDEVLIPSPYWVSYPAMVQLAGGKSVFISAGAENNFLVTVEQLMAAVTDKTKAIILNTPSNPTGGHYSQEQLDAIVRWALDAGIFIISDEIYDQLIYAPAKPASVSIWWKEFPEEIAVVNGLAKSFSMTGWRVGYTLAHEELIKAMSKIQGQSTSNICSFAQKGALAALTGPWDFVENMREAFVARRDLVLDKIATWPGAVCPKPDGAFYVFPQIDSFFTSEVADSTSLCALMLDEAGIALVPGAAFGDDRCIRISYALSEQVLTSALDKIGQVLTRLQS